MRYGWAGGEGGRGVAEGCQFEVDFPRLVVVVKNENVGVQGQKTKAAVVNSRRLSVAYNKLGRPPADVVAGVDRATGALKKKAICNRRNAKQRRQHSAPEARVEPHRHIISLSRSRFKRLTIATPTPSPKTQNATNKRSQSPPG